MECAEGTSQLPCSAPPDLPTLTECVSCDTCAGVGENFIEGGIGRVVQTAAVEAAVSLFDRREPLFEM